MTPDMAKKWFDVISCHSNNGSIQWRFKDPILRIGKPDDGWMDEKPGAYIDFGHPSYEWRIKPKMKEVGSEQHG